MTKVQKDKRIAAIKKELKTLGIGDVYCSSGSCSGSRYFDNFGDADGNFEIDSSIDDLPFCCGVQEVGNLSLDTYNLGLNEEKIIKLASELFLLTIHPNPTQRTSRHKVKTVRPVILNSNGDTDWKFLEEQLEKMSDLYNHVSTTKNPNSGNTIKTYISI